MRKVSIIIGLLCSTLSWAYHFEIEGLCYYIMENNTVKVTYQSYSEINYAGLTDINIPTTVKYNGREYTVTCIGENAFNHCTGITSISIPETITSIEKNAFNDCSSVKNIQWNAITCQIDDDPFASSRSQVTSFSFGDKVQNIPEHLCYGMNQITSIYIPASVTNIGLETFSYCSSLQHITIDSLNTVYDSRNNCNAIILTDGNHLCLGCQSTKIPYSVNTIRANAFNGCVGLKTIHIPESVTDIQQEAFMGCTSLASIQLPNSLVNIGDKAFYDCKSLSAITIPENVYYIGEHAFNGCSALTNIKWNVKQLCDTCNDWSDYYWYGGWDGPEYYGYEIRTLFSDISKQITSFTFGDSVIYIPAGLCYGMDKVESITLPQSVEQIGGSAFVFCTALSNITLPQGLKTIGENAFVKCTALKSIRIPISVTDIGYGAFGWCSALKAIELPEGINSIKDNTFSHCSQLQTVKTPKSLEYIGDWAFIGCALLQSIDIPEGVSSIGWSAFTGCKSLKHITIPSTVYWISYSAFDDCKGITSIQWNPYGLDMAEEEYVDGPFAAICKQITSITLGDSVTHIPAGLCYGMSKLTSIDIPSSVRHIDNGAFAGCTSLGHITLPATLETLGASAFGGCAALNSIRIPEGVTTIKENTFSGCKGIKQINIPSTVTYIDPTAFIGCKGITSILYNAIEHTDNDNIDFHDDGNGYSEIFGAEYLPFYHIAGQITSFTIGDQVKHIPFGLCYGMSKLKSIVIPSSVQSIANGVFNNCTALKDITFNSSTTHLGGLVFHQTAWYKNQSNGPLYLNDILYGYKGIAPKYFTIKEGTTIINDYAFSGSYNLETIYLPRTITKIGNYAFENCGALQYINIPQNVHTIGYGAFYNCESLQSISIPDLVTRIESMTFYGCTSLKSFIFPDNIAYISSDAFYNAGTYEKGVRYVGDCLVYANVSGEYTIKSGTRFILDEAFKNSLSLNSIKIPSSVIKIGNKAFYTCPIKLVHCYATTPPVLLTDVFSSNPTCIIPQGTIDEYTKSTWNKAVGKVIEQYIK